MPKVPSYKNIKWLVPQLENIESKSLALVCLAGLPPQQDVDLLLDPILGGGNYQIQS